MPLYFDLRTELIARRSANLHFPRPPYFDKRTGELETILTVVLRFGLVFRGDLIVIPFHAAR